ncbi:MAG TPA: hypothetical protein VNH22_06730, partial [Blastocatellia bacterium]|nr:hypothetical protein [Blastocatellia bacterium]
MKDEDLEVRRKASWALGLLMMNSGGSNVDVDVDVDVDSSDEPAHRKPPAQKNRRRPASN